VTETTTTVKSASTKAGEKAIAAVAAASETLPTVVETAEVALEIPSKVVLNQKLVVTVAVLGGIAAGAGGIIAWNRFKAARAAKKIEAEVEEIVADPAV